PLPRGRQSSRLCLHPLRALIGYLWHGRPPGTATFVAAVLEGLGEPGVIEGKLSETSQGELPMDRIKIAEDIILHRRLFLGAATITVAAAQLGMIGSAAAQRGEAKLPAIKPGTNTSFGALKQINAGVLNVGYAEAGPANGPV